MKKLFVSRKTILKKMSYYIDKLENMTFNNYAYKRDYEIAIKVLQDLLWYSRRNKQ